MRCKTYHQLAAFVRMMTASVGGQCDCADNGIQLHIALVSSWMGNDRLSNQPDSCHVQRQLQQMHVPQPQDAAFAGAMTKPQLQMGCFT